MKFTNKELKELEGIWIGLNPGQKINEAEVLEMATNLVTIMQHILGGKNG